MPDMSNIQGEAESSQATPEALLVEYQAAQASAEHHDNLVWTITSIIWGANLVLLGFILNVVDSSSMRGPLTVLSILGILLPVAVLFFTFRLNSVKRQKYVRCREIEGILHLRQHTTVLYTPGLQRWVYTAVTIALVVVWGWILWSVWIPSG